MASSPQDASAAPPGFIKPATTWGDYNNIQFAIAQALAKMQTATLVKVVACTNDGDDSPVGFVDVQPLVNQLDAEGIPTPHVTIYNVPYLRVQGGANAIILDPQPGDIGMCVFASRDLSKVKATKAQANPGSARSYSFSDGMYCGGMLNGTPTQYVQFSDAGITIVSPTAVLLKAPVIQIHAGVRWSWDVFGFGEQWEHTGGTDWTHTTWQTGATVTDVVLPINPPDGTPSS